ncbi:hypothetical protein [uncultured Nostoc sp.]|uniref:hypothetical protein n=1 Tax=uncultured Nostoc sp. TaxID=340711 RepID=UPI0035CAC969
MIPTGKCDVYDGLRLRTSQRQPDFSQYLENLSLNLSPFRLRCTHKFAQSEFLAKKGGFKLLKPTNQSSNFGRFLK